MLFAGSRWRRNSRYSSSFGQRRADRPFGHDAEPALKAVGISTGLVLSLVCAAVLDARSARSSEPHSSPRASLANVISASRSDWESFDATRPFAHRRFIPSLSEGFMARVIRLRVPQLAAGEFVELGFGSSAEGRYIIARTCSGLRLIYDVSGADRLLVDERALPCPSADGETVEVIPESRGVSIRLAGAEMRFSAGDLRRGVVSHAAALRAPDGLVIDVEQESPAGER